MAKLYFRYSAMNAGKSTALIQVAHNYEENGRRVALYTAAIDHRFGVGMISSRIGPQREAKTFDETLLPRVVDISGMGRQLADQQSKALATASEIAGTHSVRTRWIMGLLMALALACANCEPRADSASLKSRPPLESRLVS